MLDSCGIILIKLLRHGSHGQSERNRNICMRRWLEFAERLLPFVCPCVPMCVEHGLLASKVNPTHSCEKGVIGRRCHRCTCLCSCIVWKSCEVQTAWIDDRVALVTVPYQRQRHNINRPIESKWFRREIFILNLAIELMNTEYQTSHIKHRRKRTSAGVVQKAVLKFLCYTLNAAIGIIRSATSTKQRLIQ